MKTTISTENIHRSVIAVPPLCRDPDFKPNAEENARLIKHIESGGVNIMLYGGNANFYNIALSEYELVLDQLEAAAADTTIIIPAVGPYHGFMMDQAAILSRRKFPTAMLLPTMAVSKPEGVRAAIMNLAQTMGKPAVLYIKDEGYVNLEVVKSLVKAGVISWIKYAVVREDPTNDPLLEALSKEIPNELLVSGIGEQPAVIHWNRFNVQAFTSGCACIAPRPSQKMLEALQAGSFAKAERIREGYVALETLRNTHGPIQVLHEAVKLSGVADTGPHLPLLADLNASAKIFIHDAANSALAWNKE